MPQKPTMPSPYMKAVDASKPITFSCNIDSRDTIIDYEFMVDEMTTNSESRKYILPPVFVGTYNSEFYKMSFYKDPVNSTEYTLLAEAIGERKSSDASGVRMSKKLFGTTSVTVGSTKINRAEVARVIYNKGNTEFIPSNCFYGMSGLKKCEIYGSYEGDKFDVMYSSKDVENVITGINIFYNCNNLEEAIFPRGIILRENIPKSLKKLTFCCDSKLISSDDGKESPYLFKGNNVRIEEIVLDTGETSNEVEFTQVCDNVGTLKSVSIIGNGLLKIGEKAFQGCSNLKNFFTETSHISSIGDNAFSKSGLEQVFINNKLSSLGANTFSDCKYLSSIYIYSLSEVLINNLPINQCVCSNSGVDGKINVYYLGSESNLSVLKSALEDESVEINYVSMYSADNFTPVPIYGGNGVSSILSHTKDANTLENDKEYSWSVKMTDALGNTTISPSYYFKTCGASRVEIDEHLSINSKDVTPTERCGYLEVDYEIHQGSPLIVEETSKEITDDATGDATGGLMEETVENLKDDIYYYSKSKEVYCNVSTSVQLEQDENLIYYFKLPYYPLGTEIYVSNIEAENNSIKLEFDANVTSDDGTILYKFKVINIDTDMFTKDNWYRLDYNCCFEEGITYRITYSFVKPLEGYSHSFHAVYNMENTTDKFIPVKSHRWELYEKTDVENVLIDETGEVFSAYLFYKYGKFLPSKNYIIKIEIENDEGFVISDTYKFSTAEVDENSIEVLPEISLDRKHNAVVLDFSECSYQNRYSIIRKDVSNGKYKSIADSIAGGCKVFDYTVASNTEHIYTVYELKNNVLSAKDLEPITPRWTSTSVIGFSGSYADKGIISADKENVWGFGLNIGEREYSQVLSKNIISSIGSRYAKSISGMTNYRTFSLSGYLGEVDCESKYINDTALLSRKWDKFAASPLVKFVVDTKGHVFICDVTDSSYGYADEYAEQPTTINVSFAEIAPSDNISLVRVERGG